MYVKINLNEWNDYLNKIKNLYNIIAPIKEDKIDFKVVKDDFDKIIYNSFRTILPLKSFFFPVKEDVTGDFKDQRFLILGAKSCDLVALEFLDKIFLEPEFEDFYYKNRREKSIIVGSDCYEISESCHCLAYGINPYPEKLCDVILNKIDEKIILNDVTEKGRNFIEEVTKSIHNIEEVKPDDELNIRKKRGIATNRLKLKIRLIPDQKKTAILIKNSDEKVWQEYSKKCVSCGACVIACPSCHCFILLDIPNPEKIIKIRSYDACQYPGFERVAAGIDPLEKHWVRFKNRYECKFIRRVEKYNLVVCTGCGRCSEVCIGKIDKNEVIRRLEKSRVTKKRKPVKVR
jgi:ferredoxin